MTKASKSQSQLDLYSHIQEAKNNKKTMTKQLKKSISSSQTSIIKSPSEPSISQIQKSFTKKQRSLTILKQALNQRMKIDKFASLKLDELTNEQLNKKGTLQRKIQEIKQRNQQRVKQLKQFEDKYLKKLNQDYRKDKQKQSKLLLEYENVMQQQGKIKQTQQYRKAIQSEDWQEIIKQKQKLQKMVKEFSRKQNILIKDQNPQALIKLQKANNLNNLVQEQEKQKNVQKIQVKKRERVKKDMKQIGNQYLQFAKQQKQPSKQKQRQRMLNVNLKCIDYQHQIIQKIARNTGDLSKIRAPPQQPIVTVRDPKVFKQLVKQDENTKRYLKQIRSNLEILKK